jgi:hypothetical protein
MIRLSSLLLAGLVLAAGLAASGPAAAAAPIPVDDRGLPQWEVRAYTDFPVRFAAADAAALGELLARVPLAEFDRGQVRIGSDGAGVRRLVVETRVTPAEADALTRAGVSWARLPDLEQEARRAMERVWAEQAAKGGAEFQFGKLAVYHTYAQIGQILQQTALDHPAIAASGSIGQSVNGRELWSITISDNVGNEEAEPEVRLASTIHGNEPPGLEMLLFLVDHLTNNYGIDPAVTNLVDNYEIHIIPCLNPDGLVAGVRRNAHNVDLNRNFPVPDGTIGDDGTWTEEPETLVIKNHGYAHSFVLSENGHAGALVVNYPWDYQAPLAPDNDAMIQLALEYSTYNLPMYNGSFYHGITNGYAWYEVNGSLQDWAYHETGALDNTIECSNTFIPPASQLDQLWLENRESFMHFIKAARYGVNGVVTDAQSGAPVFATVTVAGNTKPVHTDPDHGDYYKLLATGTYALTFSAPGYVPQTVTGVATTWGTPTVLDVALAPLLTSHVGGHVRNTGGAGLDATIAIHTHPAGTPVTTVYASAAAGGAYAVDLTYGDYRFDVSSTGYTAAGQILTVNDPTETFDFVLEESDEVILALDDFEGGAGQWTGGWGLTTVAAHSPTHAMTDSPAGNYPANVTNPCALSAPVDLTRVSAATLTFWAHWDIETDWDCAKLEVSTDGGQSWAAVATNRTVPGSGQGTQVPAGVPVFEGTQLGWVENTVDLAPWLTRSDVRFRFLMRSDGSSQRDGFYFDDFAIRGPRAAQGIDELAVGELGPRVRISMASPFAPGGTIRVTTREAAPARLTLHDVAGRLVRVLAASDWAAGAHAVSWDGRTAAGARAPRGVYFLRVESGAQSATARVVLVH